MPRSFLQHVMRNRAARTGNLISRESQVDSALPGVLDTFLGAERTIVLEAGKAPLRGTGPLAVLTGPASRRVADKLRTDGFERVQGFALLPSRKKTRWLIPLDDRLWAVGGLEIYAPHARRARLLKELLLAITKVGWNGWARDRVLVAARGPLPLEVLVSKITGEGHPVFSLSVGNQRAVRKLTVQVMRPNAEILGYIKVGVTDAASHRVRHEACVLRRLSEYPGVRAYVPRVLYAGPWGDRYLLFQSALGSRPGPSSFTGIHEDFLDKLWSIQQLEKPGSVLVGKTAARWQKVKGSLDSWWRRMGEAALERAQRELDGVTVRCGIMHGDFAPWNTRVENGHLLLFDWESADLEAPTRWDVFHFHVQTACFLNKSGGHAFAQEPKPADTASFLLYLMSSVCQLVEEGADQTGIQYRQTLLARQLA